MKTVNERLNILSLVMSLITLAVPGCEQIKEETIDKGVQSMQVKRLLDQPIITPELDESIGENIQGPSVIRVPDWVENRLGKYYLYFADHKGSHIRLAYADDIVGPWKIHTPGSLQLADTHFLVEPPAVSAEEIDQIKIKAAEVLGGMANLPHDLVHEITAPHIASPDVHVDEENRKIIMYFHGLQGVGIQLSRVATSSDGIHFTALPEVLGRTYMRAFTHQNQTYVMAMPGILYRSENRLSGFEKGPQLFNKNMRHSAILKRCNTLYVFWTQVGDAPERILLSTVDASGDWMSWQESASREVLRPEYVWEGADAPLEPSMRSVAYGKVNQLRDPAIFEDQGRIYLFYAVAGESGIAVAEITELPPG